MICWTLGITEHHNAVDNVFALINLALLDRSRRPLRQRPQSAARPEQRAGRRRHGRDSRSLAGFSSRSPMARACKIRKGLGREDPAAARLAAQRDVRRDGARRHARAVRDRRKPGRLGSRPSPHRAHPAATLDCLVVQDLYADADGAARARRVARLRPAGANPKARSRTASGACSACAKRRSRTGRGARRPRIVCDLARRLGHDWGRPSAEDVWNEVRALSPMHAGMSYARLEENDGLRWPCYDEQHPGEQFLHARLVGEARPRSAGAVPCRRARAAGRRARRRVPAALLTTGRRFDSFNSGVQSGEYTSPLRRGESLDLSPEDCARYAVADGELVRITSRRGSVEAPVRVDPTLRPGLAFMTFHFDVATNVLTIEANDPKSGTAEFKASAIRIDKIHASSPRAGDLTIGPSFHECRTDRRASATRSMLCWARRATAWDGRRACDRPGGPRRVRRGWRR